MIIKEESKSPDLSKPFANLFQQNLIQLGQESHHVSQNDGTRSTNNDRSDSTYEDRIDKFCTQSDEAFRTFFESFCVSLDGSDNDTTTTAASKNNFNNLNLHTRDYISNYDAGSIDQKLNLDMDFVPKSLDMDLGLGGFDFDFNLVNDSNNTKSSSNSNNNSNETPLTTNVSTTCNSIKNYSTNNKQDVPLVSESIDNFQRLISMEEKKLNSATVLTPSIVTSTRNSNNMFNRNNNSNLPNLLEGPSPTSKENNNDDAGTNTKIELPLSIAASVNDISSNNNRKVANNNNNNNNNSISGILPKEEGSLVDFTLPNWSDFATKLEEGNGKNTPVKKENSDNITNNFPIKNNNKNHNSNNKKITVKELRSISLSPKSTFRERFSGPISIPIQPINSNRPKPRGRKPSIVPDGSKQFLCTICSRRFRRQEHMKRHIRTIHFQERPYTCYVCEKTFSRSDNLNQHLRTHTRNYEVKHPPLFNYDHRSSI
ncbi:C2H2-type zinc finger protein NDAI_0G03420 [Naumovozyma dairenensis CBS 421]|uniref:C2H2-type domain-containing protein n=1 Tax=Naumovozyma dairenensis (strain ATCC 10597 / BCRC 20456 / CBS 421 / NBRC 0211 / NRRL Y-12639) TaxID=1071378 RepID=G0WEA8_NAUDC|nr:hypothetical protein NDAI_0G03420 [Naumovozyma dairenensis CBS 421]CCD26119.2 hypothetical protein NDAI_0G03420 [Naumovozyma dairenensis CBS 421]